jgi:hypothetical protein
MEQSAQSSRPRRNPLRSNPHRTTERWNNEDHARLLANAERAGMNVSSYIRVRALEDPTTPSRRQVTVDLLALAKALALVNRMGGNLHQIARHLNFGGYLEPGELRTALAGYEAMVAAILAAMGRRP